MSDPDNSDSSSDSEGNCSMATMLPKNFERHWNYWGKTHRYNLRRFRDRPETFTHNFSRSLVAYEIEQLDTTRDSSQEPPNSEVESSSSDELFEESPVGDPLENPECDNNSASHASSDCDDNVSDDNEENACNQTIYDHEADDPHNDTINISDTDDDITLVEDWCHQCEVIHIDGICESQSLLPQTSNTSVASEQENRHQIHYETVTISSSSDDDITDIEDFCVDCRYDHNEAGDTCPKSQSLSDPRYYK